MTPRVHLAKPWLDLHLPRPMRVLSWAPYNAGFRQTDLIRWREVRNADLSEGFDVDPWFAAQMQAHPLAVGMLTSRDVGTYHEGFAVVEGVAAHCLATVGLSNGESVGRRLPYHSADYGTINLAVTLDAALTEAAQLEALSIAVQARTVGVLEAGVQIGTGLVSGTGTDCCAIACDAGTTPYAGMHTAIGEVVGAVVRDTLTRAAMAWVVWRDAERARLDSLRS